MLPVYGATANVVAALDKTTPPGGRRRVIAMPVIRSRCDPHAILPSRRDHASHGWPTQDDIQIWQPNGWQRFSTIAHARCAQRAAISDRSVISSDMVGIPRVRRLAGCWETRFLRESQTRCPCDSCLSYPRHSGAYCCLARLSVSIRTADEIGAKMVSKNRVSLAWRVLE
jgi:hypothetical protein